jgi:hypothetical protein
MIKIDNRTGVDFSRHELHVTNQDGLVVHFLKKPDTNYDCIKFINTNGIMAVTGDYGNWIFCREFHPNAKGGVSSMYWHEKLEYASSQEGREFDGDLTKEEILMGLDTELEAYGYEGEKLCEIKEYYTELLDYVGLSQWEYEAYAYSNIPSFLCAENVPYIRKTKIWLQIIFDGFDEICRRLKEAEDGKTI